MLVGALVSDLPQAETHLGAVVGAVGLPRHHLDTLVVVDDDAVGVARQHRHHAVLLSNSASSSLRFSSGRLTPESFSLGSLT